MTGVQEIPAVKGNGKKGQHVFQGKKYKAKQELVLTLEEVANHGWPVGALLFNLNEVLEVATGTGQKIPRSMRKRLCAQAQAQAPCSRRRTDLRC